MFGFQEWWNTESLPEYLRKWNPVIHEWLKAYLYRPLRSCSVKAWQATLIILVISAFEHDLLLSAGLGYFVPVYMIEYAVCGKSRELCSVSLVVPCQAIDDVYMVHIIWPKDTTCQIDICLCSQC